MTTLEILRATAYVVMVILIVRVALRQADRADQAERTREGDRS